METKSSVVACVAKAKGIPVTNVPMVESEYFSTRGLPTAPTKPTPVTDELTVEMVRDYLTDLPDNTARVAAINAESDAVVTLSRDPDVGCATLRFTKVAFKVEQEHFTYVYTPIGGWYVRAATPDERALLP